MEKKEEMLREAVPSTTSVTESMLVKNVLIAVFVREKILHMTVMKIAVLMSLARDF